MHFQSSRAASDRIRAHDVIKLVAHRVVHGGNQKEPMAIWPGHEQGLEELDKISEFAPLHVSLSPEIVGHCSFLILMLNVLVFRIIAPSRLLKARRTRLILFHVSLTFCNASLSRAFAFLAANSTL